MKRSLFVASLLVGAPTSALALDVAPQVVIIDAKDQSGALLLRNGAASMVEVEVDVRFGFEVADADGKVRAHYPEVDVDDRRSASSFLRVYPRRSRLAPGEERVVRILARPPAELPSGEYWARASVRAVPVIPPSTDHEDRIRLQVGVTTEQRIPVFVRHGRAAATAHIQKAEWTIERRADQKVLAARYFVGLEGTGAFLGTVEGRVVLADGREIGVHTKNLAVFESGWRRIEVPFEGDLPADARLELSTTREHPAVTSDDLLPGGVTQWSTALAAR